MLANELGRRGIAALLVDRRAGTAFNPQANATQARTMEHYRRLGFADEIRALGLPRDYPTDIAYFTRFARHELARFSLPSAREAKEPSRAFPARGALPSCRIACDQKYVEPVLRRHAEALPAFPLTINNVSGFARKTRQQCKSIVARTDHRMQSTSSARTARGASCASSSGSATAARPASCATSWAAGCSRCMPASRISTARTASPRPG